MTFKLTGGFYSGLALAVSLAIGIPVAGCGNKATVPKAATSTQDFAPASPELKADWDKVTAAVKSNDYATAILTCRKLQAQVELTAEQRKVVNDTLTAVSNQLVDAAAKGDQNAINALEEVHKGWRPR
jgi:outer membrane murein-binding lipoprotein Lpp